jgi:transcriptional regulator with GAF, ATPase, and Fis domain
MVRQGTFREDLYYRLSVFPVALPPLRERRDDIPLLVHFLLEKSAQRVGKRLEGVDRETMQRLVTYTWPGNVRELENVVERWAILSPGPHLTVPADTLQTQSAATSASAPAPAVADDQPLTVSPPSPASDATSATSVQLEAVERTHIKSVLEQAGWVIEGPKGAAAALGLHPSTLRSRMKKLGITKP